MRVREAKEQLSRLLVVCPSWVGDVVMATPALRMLREALPGAFIGGLVRPGLDEVLAGSGLLDEMHVDRARGVMGPKVVAAKLRPRRYDAALLLTNSFSTALITRLAFIPRRVGYERDGRGMLLTDRLQPPRRSRPHRGWAPVSAVEYYVRAAQVLLEGVDGAAAAESVDARLELGITAEQDAAATEVLRRAGVMHEGGGECVRYAVLNPGGNNPAKRWPAERFAAVGEMLLRRGVSVVVNGSPGEREVTGAVVEPLRSVAASVGGGTREEERVVAVDLSTMGGTIGSLKGVVRRAALMVTNDTGPRHIAAAFGVPTVALFGPTDARWTTLGDSSAAAGMRERVIVADPTLPVEEVADDHPERCRIDRITVEVVKGAVREAMGWGSGEG